MELPISGGMLMLPLMTVDWLLAPPRDVLVIEPARVVLPAEALLGIIVVVILLRGSFSGPKAGR